MANTRVLFVCTHYSARSQMAEGPLRHLAEDRFEAVSAGTEATSVRPEAIKAMAELGVDISGQESKTLQHYLGQPFDYVVTVCDDANEACPFFPGANCRLHWVVQRPFSGRGKRGGAPQGIQGGARWDPAPHQHRAPRRERAVTKLSIEPACREELSRIFELLQESDLPPDGFEDHLLTTLVTRHEDQVVGSAALSSSTVPQRCCGQSR